MLNPLIRCVFVVVLCASALVAQSTESRPSRLDPVPFTHVSVADAFWSPRLTTNRTVTIPYAMKMCEETGRVANFEAAAKHAGTMRGLYFNDSDVYKVLEGAAYALAVERDAALESRCDEIIAKIAAAQEPDGYLYTPRQILDRKNMPPGGKERWSDMGGGHELYCLGHLYEAAVAYSDATGKNALLDVATKSANLIVGVFGPGRNTHPCGHPEIEIGLVKLFRKTRDQRYLDLAKFFIDARGHADGRELYGEYAQDHLPLLEQKTAVGHAVRAAYLFAGIADVAGLTGEPSYLVAIDRLWRDVVGTKLYLTGGIGSQGNNEGFGAPFDLPNSSAYAETCAAIANALWNHRLFLAFGDARYVDVLERVIYNGFLSGWSSKGDRFFYPNPLESAHGRERSPWFDCSCCPSNVVRFVPSIPGFAYATSGDGVHVNLYLGGAARVRVADHPVTLTQETNYPWDGRVKIRVDPKEPTAFKLRLRIPGWARGEVFASDLYTFADVTDARATIAVDGVAEPITLDRGYAVLERQWKAGDVVELDLPMPVRRVIANASVRADQERTAFMRGPIVYCFEGHDQPDGRVLDRVATDTAFKPVARPGLLGGVTVLEGRLTRSRRTLAGSIEGGESVEATAIPYFAWANRGRSPMSVWVARAPAAARPDGAPTLAKRSRATSSFGGELAALADQFEPASSGDHANPFLHWWPRLGTKEWIQYDFPGPTRVHGVEVYWFDDTGRGACRLPKSWRLLANVAGTWREVDHPSAFDTRGDTYNRCTFDPLTTLGLRIEVQSVAEFAGGVHEWRVLEAPLAEPPSAPQDAGENLLPNGSFERASGGRADAWATASWNGQATFTADEPGRNGGRSVAITSDAGADVAWGCTVPVSPGSRYRLSGWIRTEDVTTKRGGRGALFNLHDLQPIQTAPVLGTTDWTRVEVEFETEDVDAVTVNALFGGWGQATGKAWFDDVSLTLVRRAAPQPPSITIHADQRLEPLSKYVYGQFIEHLGRCIYGGIWAEMLQDRKFFDAIGSPGSAWRIVGPPGAVRMTTDRPFVGEHSPEVVLTHGIGVGIEQTGLTTEERARYVGHVWLAGDAAAGPVEITLVTADSGSVQARALIPTVGPEFLRTDFEFEATSSGSASLRIVGRGKGSFRIGTASLMPASNVKGMRRDTLRLLRDLDAPVYRWPGGNFVSGYDWRDGVGDRDRRPPRKNPAWSGIEHDDFGIDEFMILCQELGTEPYVVVNTGLGSIESAVAELEYMNGSADSPHGKLRARNGHPTPYAVKWIGVGNEMFGSWQLGNIPLAEYTKRHNAFVDALRAKDPSIKVIGVGAAGEWSERMLTDCQDRLDLLSEHVYWQERAGLRAHVGQPARTLGEIAAAHRDYRRRVPGLAARDIRLVQDEWNYWYGPHVFGELGTRYFQKDALGCAAALNTFARNSDLFFMANYAQTVNVIGAVKTSATRAAMETTGLVLQMYRERFGVVPCATDATVGLDAVAAFTADGRALTIAMVNASNAAVVVPFVLKGTSIDPVGDTWFIAASPDAYNDPDQAAPSVRIQTAKTGDVLAEHGLRLAPCSVTMARFTVR